MKLDLSIVISVVSVAFAVFTGIWNLSRNKKNDDQTEAANMAVVIVKLENIANDISEIKGEMRSLKKDVQNLHERVALAEQLYKALHARLDSAEETIKNLAMKMSQIMPDKDK